MIGKFLWLSNILVLLSSAAFADTLVVGNKREHSVSFINLKTGKEVARRETGKAPHEIAVSPDGTLAVLVSYREPGYEGNSLHVFDVETASKLRVIDLGEHKGPHGLKWIPNTQRVIATTEITQDVVIVDVDKGTPVGAIKTDQQGSHMVALSPNSERAYVANIGGGSFSIIDLKTMTKIQDVKAGRGTEAITVSPDGTEIWVGNNGSRSIMIFNAETFEKIDEIKTKGIPIRVETSPDGRVMAVSQPDQNNVVIYNRKTRDIIEIIDLKPAKAVLPVTMLFSPEGRHLWVAATQSAKVVEIDTKNWSITRSFDAGNGSDGLAFSNLDTVVSQE